MEILECVNLVKRRRDIYLIFKGRSRSEANVRKIKVNTIARKSERGAEGGNEGLTYGEGTQTMKGPIENKLMIQRVVLEMYITTTWILMLDCS